MRLIKIHSTMRIPLKSRLQVCFPPSLCLTHSLITFSDLGKKVTEDALNESTVYDRSLCGSPIEGSFVFLLLNFLRFH